MPLLLSPRDRNRNGPGHEAWGRDDTDDPANGDGRTRRFYRRLARRRERQTWKKEVRREDA